jgi:hypothetical protein
MRTTCLHSILSFIIIGCIVPSLAIVAAQASQFYWQSPLRAPPFNPSSMLLLTDGTVIVQDYGVSTNGGSDWWKFSPDITGSYVNGRWSAIAPMPPGYNPLYYASAVLPTGQVIVEGGEYDLNINKFVWLGLGALYEPGANKWISVAPPKGMATNQLSIGNADGIVLANGKFMLSPVYTPASGPQQILNLPRLTWTASGQNKSPVSNYGESQVLLPSGRVLTVDVGNTADPERSEIFSPINGEWSSAGDTKVQITSSSQAGPLLLRPNGTVFAVGTTGHNAVYSSTTGLWSVAPDFPIINGLQYEEALGPAAVLPSGRVLVMASAAGSSQGSHFFIFDGVKLARAVDSPNAASILPALCRMLVLPNGQIMLNTGGKIYFFNENQTGPGNSSWAPSIIKVAQTLRIGSTYRLFGSQLSGLSQGAAYGNNYQSATNYPLIRIANKMSGHVFYARTFGFVPSVAPKIKSYTSFTVPNRAETGLSTLVTVANGVSSRPVVVNVTRATP